MRDGNKLENYRLNASLIDDSRDAAIFKEDGEREVKYMNDKKADVLDPWNNPISSDEWAESIDKLQKESDKFQGTLENSNTAKTK